MFIPVKILHQDESGHELEAVGICPAEENEVFVQGWLRIDHVSAINRHPFKDDRTEVALLCGIVYTVEGTLEDLVKKMSLSGRIGFKSGYADFLNN